MPQEEVAYAPIASLSDVYAIDVPFVLGAIGFPAAYAFFEALYKEFVRKEDIKRVEKKIPEKEIVSVPTPYYMFLDQLFDHFEQDRKYYEEVRKRDVAVAYENSRGLINLLRLFERQHDDTNYKEIANLQTKRNKEGIEND